MKNTVIERLNVARELSKEVKPRMKTPGFSGIWRGLGRAPNDSSNWGVDTRISRDVLDKVSATIQNIPPTFTVHPKVQKGVLDKRIEMIRTGQGIDWGCGEMLAFGSLLLEGNPVREADDTDRGGGHHGMQTRAIRGGAGV